MRYKFRGRRVDTGEWMYGNLFQEASGKDYIIHSYYDGEYCEILRQERFEVDPETVGQWTGLVDRNGKDIYEKDIFKPRYNRFKPIVVELVDGQYSITGYNLKKCEVIGNIFEHKHLLGVNT